MESLGSLVAGFYSALTLGNFPCNMAGVLLGQIIGVLPGRGPVIVLSLAGPLVWRVLRRKSTAAEDARSTQ